MAIIPDVPGITASVTVARQLATEYEPPDGEIPTEPNQRLARLPACHRYIESKTGADFQINFEATSDFSFPGSSDTINVHIYIDGAHQNSWKLHSDRLPVKRHLSKTTTLSPDGSKSIYQKFIFAQITSAEDADGDTIANDVQRAQELGVIKIVVKVGKFDGYRQQSSSSSQSARADNESLELSEKAMKGKELSHGTCFVTVPGVVRPSKPMRSIVKHRSEVAVFYFHYRSRDALCHEMILPRSPPATSAVKVIQDLTQSDDEGFKVIQDLTQSDDKGFKVIQDLTQSDDEGFKVIQDLTQSDDEGFKVIQDLTQSDDEGFKVIQDLTQSDDEGFKVKPDPAPRVKRERDNEPVPSTRLKAVKLSDGREAIDLTDD